MVRKARSEGPSLFCEWAIGSSINAAMRKLEKERLEREQEEAEQERNVIKLEITTDDESEVDSVRVTYPRKGTEGSSKRGAKSSSRVKQVRFEQGSLKPALKKKSRRRRAYESSESDTIASETDGTDTTRSADASTSEPSDSEGVSTDTSSSRRRRSHKSRMSKAENSGDSDASHDSNYSDRERRVVKKKLKSRGKYESVPESSTGSERERQSKREGKRRRSKKQASRSHKDDRVDVDEGSDTSSHEDEKSHRRKERSKHQSKDVSPKDGGHASSRHGESDPSSEEKAYPEAMPGPHPRRPNLIRPIRAEVMQVEHTVEGPEDPRPNAFVDERNNVVRVYHGPAYGNPFGKLYPRRDPSLQPLPVGVPHPLHNKYYYGFRDAQNRNHSHSREGHMPVTLGDPYWSIPAQAPINQALAPEPQDMGNQNLTSGLWGINSGPSKTTKNKAPSWSNNIGPPQPSTSLRQANPSSRWAFGSSKKKDDGNEGAKNSWGDAGNHVGDAGSWGARGGDQASQWGNDGGTTTSWGAGGGDNTGDWRSNGGGDANNEGTTGDNWAEGNDDTGFGNSAWDSANQGGDTWGGNENAGDAPNNQSPSLWGGQNNDTSWGDTGNNDSSWGDNNVGDTWGGANNNKTSWEGGTDNASNNVGPPGNASGGGPSAPQDFSPAKHVPGSWDDASQKPFPPWGDPTAAQSTRNQGGYSWS